MKKVIYTAIFGDYDVLLEPAYITPNWDYICFTDNKEITSTTWKIIYLNLDLDLDNTRKARNVKVLYYNYVNEYDLNIWIDANIKINSNLDEFVNLTTINGDDAAFMMHPDRECIYQELNTCVKYKKDDPEILYKYKFKLLNEEKYPRLNGLIQTNVIVRYNTEQMKFISEKWWQEILNYSKRDQLSLNYILWKYNKIQYSIFSADILKFRKFILYTHLLDGTSKESKIRSDYGDNYYYSYSKNEEDNDINFLNLSKRYSLLSGYNIKYDDTIIFNNLKVDSDIVQLIFVNSYKDILNNIDIYTNTKSDFIVFTLNDYNIESENVEEDILMNYSILFKSDIKIIKVFNEIEYLTYVREHYKFLIKHNRKQVIKNLYMLKYFYYLLLSIETITDINYSIILYSITHELFNDYQKLKISKLDYNTLYYYKCNYIYGHANVMHDFLQQFNNFYNYIIKKTFIDNVKDYMKNSGIKFKTIK